MSIDLDKARSIFLSAVESCPPEQWDELLSQACGDDVELRQRVELLLKAHQGEDRLLDRGEDDSPKGATQDPPPTERPGTVIGPYKLLQEIGHGGMGVVYMAEQTAPVERRVALKIIKPGMDTRQVIARFEAERQALAMMDHPNIAKVLDAGTTGEPSGNGNRTGASQPPGEPSRTVSPESVSAGRPYFVMELVKGVPITQYCDAQHLTTRERLELFVPVCQAVQHAHQKGIIHRDIKPSNVLVALYDDRPVPKVIDFGVAKATSQRLTQKTMFTQYGQIVGTVEYMSPEQAQLNQMDVDTRSDIYSLGVLLYEILVGETPFDRKRLRTAAFDEVLRIIREEEPPRPSIRLSSSETLPSIAANRQIEPGKLSTLVRGELDWIVMKALEKDRTRRYETANGFAVDILRYLHDEPVVACPPSATYRFRKFARRNRAVLATTAAILLCLIVGIAGTSWQTIRAMNAEQLANERLVAERLAREQASQAQVAEAEQRALAERERDRAEANLSFATTEQQRAEWNLDLALTALDAVYLEAIGEDKLLGEPAAKPDNEEITRITPPPLTEIERDLLKRGLDFYDQFADENADTERAYVHTARAYYRVGLLQGAIGDREAADAAYREAIQRCERLTEQAPDNPDYFQQLAEAHRGLANVLSDWIEAKKVCEASRQAYSRAIELDPQNAELYIRRGDVSASLYDGKAIADYEKSVEIDPDHIKAHLKCAQSYVPGGLLRIGEVAEDDLRKAREHAERALALAPEDPQCHLALASVLGKTDADVVFLGPATRIWRPANVEPAVQHYARAIELAPDAPVGYRMRGDFLCRIGDYAHALTDLNRALELQPNDDYTLRRRAFVFTQLGQYDKALDDFATYLTLQPHDWEAHYELGQTHAQLGNWESAVESYAKALEIDSSRWFVRKRSAVAHMNLGQYAQALADLRNALELKPNDTSTLIFIPESELLRSPDDFKNDLVELADQAVERLDDTAAALAHRGGLYAHMQQYEKAESDFAKAAELDPQSAAVWLSWGHSYMKRGMPKDAAAKYSKAIQSNPGNWLYWWSRGNAHQNSQDYEAAIHDYTKTLELYPSFFAAWINRSVAYVELGELDGIRKELADAADLELASEADLYRFALLNLAVGNRPKYRESCATMSVKFSLTGDPAVASRVAWTCALAPQAVDDFETPIALAARAVQAQPESDEFLKTLVRSCIELVAMTKRSSGSQNRIAGLRTPTLTPIPPPRTSGTSWRWPTRKQAMTNRRDTT